VSAAARAENVAAIDPEDPRPLRVHEAAKLARIGINQAYAAVARGDIPSFKVRRRILIPRKPFLAMINGGAAEAPGHGKDHAA
jgi:hypothetical protein